jgi:glycosyltransferase involved in cell wall biosynthesis
VICILTATYNRVKTLPRLLESLKLQTCKDFEWIVVDDGSTDNTEDWFLEATSDVDFKVQYISKTNGGKHSAINLGVSCSSSEWIFIVDSDDLLCVDAIEAISTMLKMQKQRDVVGLCFRKALLDGSLVGKINENSEPIELHPWMAGKYFDGDLAYVFKSNAMKANPFPEFKEEKFVPELYVWSKIGDQGRIIYFPDKVVYLCEYLEDGYTANFNWYLKKNPRGFGVFYWSQLINSPYLVDKVKASIRVIQCVFFLTFKQLRK